jgi:uncharacterized membrane protein
MKKIATQRIQSLDLLKGIVMVIMALDHTRDYFHYDAFFNSPTDPLQTDTFIYLTRWITHFCAPAFCFLAGISAYLVGMRKSKKELSIFLLKRGIWLVLVEVVIVNFGWFFNIHFGAIPLQVIWSLGISMLFLAAMIHLPFKSILWCSLLIIFGHNLLDNIHFEDNLLWSILHERGRFTILDGRKLFTAYPIIPWVGVMTLGYYFGSFYRKTIEPVKRQKLFTMIGIGAIVLFLVARGINSYGNSNHWQHYDTILQTLFSFFNPSKYPPSLTFLLMTLGVTFLFLGNSEKLKGRLVNIFSVFGKVPFFYYILHIYLIHLSAMLLAQLTGFGWKVMLLKRWVTGVPELDGYGLHLSWVYIVWIGIVISLYPLCKRFGQYKLDHKEKWWLGYL